MVIRLIIFYLWLFSTLCLTQRHSEQDLSSLHLELCDGVTKSSNQTKLNPEHTEIQGSKTSYSATNYN
jgi:hypothetical protein